LAQTVRCSTARFFESRSALNRHTSAIPDHRLSPPIARDKVVD
jgi:hypothetical protein